MIAAICNEKGNVMGMMPHPERASEAILTVNGNRSINNDAIRILLSLVSNLKLKATA
jgi:phosphoribosylformylglycinamidine synthase